MAPSSESMLNSILWAALRTIGNMGFDRRVSSARAASRAEAKATRDSRVASAGSGGRNQDGSHRRSVRATSSRTQTGVVRQASFLDPFISASHRPSVIDDVSDFFRRSVYNKQGLRVTTGLAPDGESGRTGINYFTLIRICWHSSNQVSRFVNILWPVVPVAITVTMTHPDSHLLVFILNYIAMVPCANLIGFAGAELARKLTKVLGILIETTLGSVVEIVLFMVLLFRGEYEVIKAAILGSILATKLLCLGLCFYIGGLKYEEQEFEEKVSEVGSDLLLQAGLGLIVPAAFRAALASHEDVPDELLNSKVLAVSRWTSIILLCSYILYVWFQMRSSSSIYDAIFEADEDKADDHEEELERDKLTLSECVFALVISLALVTFIAMHMIHEIPFLVEERGVSDSFVGLILVPLVEKFAEHLSAINEAHNNSMNLALSHVLGATIQTALFNAPIVVLVGWIVGMPMDLDFDLFNIVVLILAILVVGNFLKDGSSNYLEGGQCILIYCIIAVAAWYYPNPSEQRNRIGLAGQSTTP